jgi:hypothetical protein
MEKVTDIRSNLNDQLANAATIIGRSLHRQRVFRTIYRGKKKIKTIEEIASATKLTSIAVLNAGGRLAASGIVKKVFKGYQKDDFFAKNYRRILAMASDPEKRKKLPTKINPKGAGSVTYNIRIQSRVKRPRFITIDDMDSFSEVRRFRKPLRQLPAATPEETIKKAICRIIGEKGTFKDWGGERYDVLTTKLRVSGKRVLTAIAFKGKATKGILTLDKMGKRADQVIRLFGAPAHAFIICYPGQIGGAILDQMKLLAAAKAIAGEAVFYGIIDGDDLARMVTAYPTRFCK